MVVREELEEEEEEGEGEERGEGWREARASSLPCLLISAAPSLPSVSSFASLPGVRPAEASLPLCWWHSSEATPVLALSTTASATAALPAEGTEQAAMERCCRPPRASLGVQYVGGHTCVGMGPVRTRLLLPACCLLPVRCLNGEGLLCPCLCGYVRG